MEGIDSRLLMLLVDYDEVFARYTAGKLSAEEAIEIVHASTVTDDQGWAWGLTPERTWYKTRPGQTQRQPADPHEFAGPADAFTTTITAPDTNPDSDLSHRSTPRPEVIWHDPPTDPGGTFYRWTPSDKPKWARVHLTGIVTAAWPWLIAAVAALLLAAAVPRIQQGASPAASRTGQTSAQVTSIDVTAVTGPVIAADGRVVQGKTSTCAAVLSYEVNGTIYTLDVTAEPNPDQPRKTPALCKTRKGDLVDIVYNPKRPSSAHQTLQPQPVGMDLRTLIEGGVLALLGVAGLVFAGLTLWRRRH